MSAPDLTSARWRKSSRSNGAQACVEVAVAVHLVGVRDSKLGQHSPIIAVDAEPWHGFLDHLRAYEH